jgi:hypothetical protein
MPIDVWYGIRKPNRPSDPDKSVGWVTRVGPPIPKLTASEIRARLAGLGISGRPVVNELLAAVDLIEVLLRIVINDELCIFVLRIVPPGALHQNERHLF